MSDKFITVVKDIVKQCLNDIIYRTEKKWSVFVNR